MRKMTNERQHQHAEALQSSSMHSLAKTVLETPKEGGCPLLPPTSIASHLHCLPPRQQISSSIRERENNTASGSKKMTFWFTVMGLSLHHVHVRFIEGGFPKAQRYF